jgi:hypothetical protein
MTGSKATMSTLFAVVTAAACVTNAWATTGEQFGKSIARSLQDGDAQRFTAFVDRDVLMDQALTGMKGNDEFVAGVRGGLERGLAQVGTILIRNMGPGEKLSYLRTRNVEGVTRVLVRLDLGDRGLNYMEFFVDEGPDGSWVIYDWLDYVQGQTYSESLRMALAFMVKENPSLVYRMLGLPEVDRTAATQIAELGDLGQQGEWGRWLEVYHTLPQNLRNSRVLLVNRIVAANVAENMDEYMNAMADLHTHHGDDPTLSLALVDYYIFAGDYARAHRAVDRLDEYTGGDAAVTNLRSGIALHKGDNAACVRHARQAIAQDADYEDPYWNLMVAGSRAGDYKAAMEGVRGLESRFGYELSEDALVGNEEFAGLMKSEEWGEEK